MPLIIILLVVLVSLDSRALRVLIDPGHGGTDQGASAGPIREAQVVLQIAQELARQLKGNPQFQVFMTRNSDRSLSLQERVKKAEEFSAEILISLHANSAPDPRLRGMEVYFQNQMPLAEENYYLANVENQILETPVPGASGALSKHSDVSEILADLQRQGRIKLSLSFAEILRASWPGSIKQAPFYVLNQPKSAAILIEVGFLSHPGEATDLLKPSIQQDLARRIYESLIKYAASGPQRKIHLTRQASLKRGLR
jgi:N-acetylmuramoyl-L-alanine amidase